MQQSLNGLQTSYEIANFFRGKDASDNRSVMVKIVESENEETRDKVIKATNHQNQVQSASLRATDKIQRDIEHHLKSRGIFYDRRKNLYKNEGKPANKIISIGLLSQALMTTLRMEPDNARARPSSLIDKDDVYNSLFSDSYPLDTYYVCADTIKKIEQSLKSSGNLTARDRNNIRFYVLYWVVAESAGTTNLSASKIASLSSKISEESIFSAIDKVKDLFDAAGGTDQIAKGPDFKKTIISAVSDAIRASRLAKGFDDGSNDLLV